MSSKIASQHTRASLRTPASTGLGEDPLLSNVISAPEVQVRILGKNPDRGLPPAGIPFSLDVEVETFRNFSNFPFFTCPDVVIVARGTMGDEGRVWAMQAVNTSALNDCTERQRIVFEPDFVPDGNHWIRLEVYTQPTFVDRVISGRVTEQNLESYEPIARSGPLNFGLSEKRALQSGVFSSRSETTLESISQSATAGLSLFKDLKTTLIVGGSLAAGAVAVYFLWPWFPAIRDGLGNIAVGKKSKSKNSG